MGHVLQILGDLEPYILQFLLGAIAIFGLVKDWKDYGDKFGRLKHLRWLLLSFVMAVLFLSLYDTHASRRDAREKEQQAEKKDVENTKHVQDLTDQVHQERDENRLARNDFRTSFASLYQRYSELLTKVQNADLLQEIRRYREQLKATDAKLTQPKPRLVASFYRPNMTTADVIKEMDAVKSKDGTVTVELTTINTGDGPALKGACVVRICWACQYAKEPDGSVHVPGSSEQEREFPFDHVFSQTTLQKQTIQIKVQPFVNRLTISVYYACENCVTDVQTLSVNLVPEMRFPHGK